MLEVAPGPLFTFATGCDCSGVKTEPTTAVIQETSNWRALNASTHLFIRVFNAGSQFSISLPLNPPAGCSAVGRVVLQRGPRQGTYIVEHVEIQPVLGHFGPPAGSNGCVGRPRRRRDAGRRQDLAAERAGTALRGGADTKAMAPCRATRQPASTQAAAVAERAMAGSRGRTATSLGAETS
ncbi:unnamed protein product [Prorocentrum cordatum]|uniref:Uncharacterized protein n=1 Tax=Prorocentrum cordatum TaxID=2364126 RepID=A0ABN9Q3E2_9DINO|nr:unnamed protein product [Polarella glacialis]